MRQKPTVRMSNRPRVVDESCPFCLRRLPTEVEREVWVEVPIDEKWTAAYRLLPQKGRPVIGEVRVFPSESRGRAGDWSHYPERVPEGGVPMAAVRSSLRASDALTPYPELLRAVRRQHGAEAVESAFLRRYGFTRRAYDEPRGRGRPRISDLYFARLASEYVWLVRQSKNPVKQLARRAPYKTRDNPAQAARDHIHEARRRELLTDSPLGRSGGELTDKARALLKDAGEGSTT